jgi:hypothetical protein
LLLSFLKYGAAWLLAMVVSIVALFAFDVLLRQLLDGRSPDLWLGLGFALLVFFLFFSGAFAVLAGWFLDSAPSWWLVLLFAGVSAAAFVVGLPYAVTAGRHSDGPRIRDQVAIPGRIDLVFVSAGGHGGASLPRPVAQPPELSAWDVRYTVAAPAGDGLELLIAGAESRNQALRALRSGRRLEPAGNRVPWRPGAQRAVVLDVDRASPASPADDRAAVAAANLGAPIFALFGPHAPRRAMAWDEWTRERHGEVRWASELEGPTALDNGLRLVSESRSTLADRQLAYAYRPLLFFDEHERYSWPVDVGSAFAEGAVDMCKHGAVGDECETVKSGADLDQSFAYLKVDPTRFGPGDRGESPQAIGSAYYYHVFHRPSGSHTYVDYWWYMPYNASLTGWMCSPGFSVTDFDCFDHESDWEGLTVEVGRDGDPPVAVFYAQHAHVEQQPWRALRRAWRKLRRGPSTAGEGVYHPLVFVARASHASYPYPCKNILCHESGSALPEGGYRGESAWAGDEDEVCAGVCLKPLPITRDGAPASWNAFSGPWGTQTCILDGTFCDRSEAPQSPAYQWRYENLGQVR